MCASRQAPWREKQEWAKGQQTLAHTNITQPSHLKMVSTRVLEVIILMQVPHSSGYLLVVCWQYLGGGGGRVSLGES
jgi:hypothetical protein